MSAEAVVPNNTSGMDYLDRTLAGFVHTISINAHALQVCALVSALTRLETRIRLADHEDLATAANDFAVAVTGLRRFQ